MARAAAAHVRGGTEVRGRAYRGRRSEPGAEGSAYLRGQFLQRAVCVDSEQTRRGSEAVSDRREGMPTRIYRGDCGGGGTERAGREALIQRRRKVLDPDAGALADQFGDAPPVAVRRVTLVAEQAHRPA